jgi:basic membrane lipoprotein Med (substrate-binding protein (PBP1-ABC) superfamily)
MTGTTASAWSDPARGGELARAQFGKGVDVVFAAAGGTGIGVYQAAKDAGKLAIGVDSNQNHLQPGTMLTSMVKRVDVAVYQGGKNFKPGITVLGLKEGGVDYADRPVQREAGHAGHEEEGRRRPRRHHRRQDQGRRLHGRQRLQVLSARPQPPSVTAARERSQPQLR